MKSITTRQNKEKIEEYIKNNGYKTSSQGADMGFVEFYK